jgi:glycine oxidase
VVLAAGAWAAGIEGAPLAPSAVEPARGQLIEHHLPAAPVRHVVFGAGGYLVPRADGRVLVGSTEERVGFVNQVTPEGLKALRARGGRLCPALRGRAPDASWAGLRPARAAGAPPLIGRSELAGLTLACGHHRNGILLAPATAEAVFALVTSCG